LMQGAHGVEVVLIAAAKSLLFDRHASPLCAAQ
jgi:hypothetical protein